MIQSGALISENGKYRYSLWRRWNGTLPVVMFIMLNPSTADAANDDPTIRKCCNYARSWGYGGIIVYNLFNLRTPNKYDILRDKDPVGNDKLAIGLCKSSSIGCDKIICAWGNGEYINTIPRAKQILRLIGSIVGYDKIFCLGVNKSLMPKHPLYLPLLLQPRQYIELHGVLGNESVKS